MVAPSYIYLGEGKGQLLVAQSNTQLRVGCGWNRQIAQTFLNCTLCVWKKLRSQEVVQLLQRHLARLVSDARATELVVEPAVR